MALAKKCDICGKLYETYNFRKKTRPSLAVLCS